MALYRIGSNVGIVGRHRSIFSIKIGFPQFKFFGHAMKNTLGKVFEKSEAGRR